MPAFKACLSGKTLRPLVSGWPSGSSGFETRFRWIAEVVNQQQAEFHYELYRPWRQYSALVFLKSMNLSSRSLAASAERKNIPCIFDLNVDYLSPAKGTFYYEGMAPTATQRQEALSMMHSSKAAIADSEWLRNVALKYHPKVCWIPDSVRDVHIRNDSGTLKRSSEKQVLLWSGEAVKLFELLKIESILRGFRKQIRLRLVTNSLKQLDRIHEPWQGRIRRLLTELSCEIIPFTSIGNLMKIYDQGGVFISPRYLENTYNMGHSEWKITLAMARGRIVLCSEQPSYVDVAERSGGLGIRICRNDDDWAEALESLISENANWSAEQEAVFKVVRNFYAASVVAKDHLAFISKIVQTN